MVLSMERWKGKIAIVTGASSGIGAAIAEALVKHGMKVVGLARREERVKELAKKLEKESGKLYAVKTDLTKESDILAAFKWAKDNLGPVHVLVNNAGVAKESKLIEVSTDEVRRIFDTNVFTLCIATQEAYKQMKANNIDDGHIFHINSMAGHRVSIPNFNVYAASKHAVRAFAETLRQELVQLKSNIRITNISPGAVKTEMPEVMGVSTEFKDLVKKMPKLDSEDLADSVIYALSTPSHVQIHEIMIKPIGELF